MQLKKYFEAKVVKEGEVVKKIVKRAIK